MSKHPWGSRGLAKSGLERHPVKMRTVQMWETKQNVNGRCIKKLVFPICRDKPPGNVDPLVKVPVGLLIHCHLHL